MNMRWTITIAIATVLGLAACGDKGSQETQEGAEPQAGQQVQPGSEQLTSVNVVEVERRSLQAWVYSQGTARSRQREFLTFTQQGVVSYVDDDLRVGSPVKTGHLIAHQAPGRVQADLQAAKAKLAESEASLALAQVTRQRYETLIKQRSASQQELDENKVQIQQAQAARDSARAQLEQAQLGVDESRLVSPMDGVLARLNIEQGRYFAPSNIQANTEQNALRTVPALVIDPNQFEVRVDLPSYDFGQIQTGARAVVGGTPPTDGRNVDPVADKNRVEGVVYAVSPSLDPETRTFEVIIRTQDNDPGLLDGGFVAVWIARPILDETLAVPLEALRFRNDQSFVFVVDTESGKVNERRVELGQQAGDFRVVIDGLEQGERVVADGRAAMHDGQQVRILEPAGSKQ